VSVLRPITEADHAAVLDWNERNVAMLAPMDHAHLLRLLALVDSGSVITHDGRDVGFVLTFAAGAAYASPNYAWFASRHAEFVYLDRIVVDASARRCGVASRVYGEIEQHARELGRTLCLEVNIDPPNEPSLAFHRSRGFVEVGRLGPAGHVVGMMELPA